MSCLACLACQAGGCVLNCCGKTGSSVARHALVASDPLAQRLSIPATLLGLPTLLCFLPPRALPGCSRYGERAWILLVLGIDRLARSS